MSDDPTATAATLCVQCHERPQARFKIGRHEVPSRFCSEACAMAYPAVPDDLDKLRAMLNDH